MTLPVTAFSAAICALLILLTAIATVQQRLKSNEAFGVKDENQPLVNAIRSHGNLTEHAPTFLIMLALLELANAHHITLMALATLFLIARSSHIIGMHAEHKAGKPPMTRSIGVIATWVCYAWAIGWTAYIIITVNL